MTTHVMSWQRNNFGPEHGVGGEWNFKIVLEPWSGTVREVPVIDWSHRTDVQIANKPITDVGEELFISVVVNPTGIVEDPPTLGAPVGEDFPNATGLIITVAIDEIRWGLRRFTGQNKTTGPNVFNLEIDGIDAFPWLPEWEAKVRGANVGGSLRCIVDAITGSSATLRPVQLKVDL